MANPERADTGPKPPEGEGSRERNGSEGAYEPGPASPEPDPAKDREREEGIARAKENLEKQRAASEQPASPSSEEPATDAKKEADGSKSTGGGHGGGHGSENFVVARLKDGLAVFDFIFSLLWQAIKRAPEMMGKGGGGGGGSKGGGHGDGGHGGGGGHH